MNRLRLLLAAFVIAPSLPSPAGDKPALILQQTVTEGLKATGLDLKNPVAVFAAVFAQLPGEVNVYPTENYFYWQLYCDGREIRGNIRLPSGQREKGILCLGYSEFDEFPADEGPEPEISASKYFNQEDGVEVSCPDGFTSVVNYRGKSVTFHFHRIPQLPPKKFTLPPNEKFVERTCDESGFQFFLLYNTAGKYFLWVLNEEAPVPDHLHPMAGDLLLGRRSGFVFWTDKANGSRKVLAAVREDSVVRNDAFDGPFDQLADNYADQSEIRKYIEEALPSCKDRVDKWGYFTDTAEPKRVALNNYGTWQSVPETLEFLEKARKSGDVLKFISKAGSN
jgi:hypothetical protein